MLHECAHRQPRLGPVPGQIGFHRLPASAYRNDPDAVLGGRPQALRLNGYAHAARDKTDNALRIGRALHDARLKSCCSTLPIEDVMVDPPLLLAAEHEGLIGQVLQHHL